MLLFFIYFFSLKIHFLQRKKIKNNKIKKSSIWLRKITIKNYRIKATLCPSKKSERGP